MADESELWHVRVAADEVKTLTLEQVDDLFRLDVIDADTLLWQPGMTEWLPLRVVAGLDDDEPVNVSVPPTAPPPRQVPVNTMSTWPPPSARSVTPPPPSARSVTPPPPSSRSAMPAKPSLRPAASVVASWPPAVARSAGGLVAAPIVSSPSQTAHSPSMGPLDVIDPPYMAARSRGGIFPIVLAAAAGLVVTLYRNDVLHAGARTVGQESAYLRLEAALGGPGFGTPRAVESMAKAAAALPEVSVPEAISTREARSSSMQEDSDTRPSTPSRPTATAEARPAPKPAVRPAPRPAARPEAEPSPVFKQPKGAKKAQGNEYDPLNPSL